MRRDVKSPQRQMRLMGIRLDGTGTASILEGAHMATLVDNNTGDYTLTLVEPLARVPVVVASPLTADVIVQLASVSATAINIKAFDATDGTTAKDADLHIMILGSEVADEV